MSDLISRSWLVEALEDSGIADSEEDGWVHSFVLGMIGDAPTVESRPSGEWIYESETADACAGWKCSNGNAGYWFPFTNEEFDFCPNCGADMRGEKHD